MLQELKIRIDNYKQIEEKLKNLGASFIDEKTFVDTYFNQPPSEVLKLAKINSNFFLQILKATDGKFSIVKVKSLHETEVDKMKFDLEKKYGIKRILQGKRRNFQLDDLKITINLIDEIGEFLILTGENPTEAFITEKLGIKDPEYIRVSFDEVKEEYK